VAKTPRRRQGGRLGARHRGQKFAKFPPKGAGAQGLSATWSLITRMVKGARPERPLIGQIGHF